MITFFSILQPLIVCFKYATWYRWALTSLVAVQGAFPSFSLGTTLCCPLSCILQCHPCILQWVAHSPPSLITTRTWWRGTAHPRGPNNCCYRQTRPTQRPPGSTYHNCLKKVHKPSNEFCSTKVAPFFKLHPRVIADLASQSLIFLSEFTRK